MIREQRPVNNTSNFAGEEFEGEIDETKLSSILDLLIRNYNSPELATLREWVSNASDSHGEAGVKKKIRVTLPSKFSSTLSVEDFGVGMSYEDIRQFYVKVLNSTKDKSNDGIGGFGIGGKSALALSDQYTMATVKDGLKNVLIFERSDTGGLKVKPVVKNKPTDEPSGVKVTVAVSNWNFKPSEINAVLEGWRSDELELVNGDFTSFYDDADEYPHGLIKRSVFESKTDDNGYGYYGFRNQRSKARVLVGPVAYELPQAVVHELSKSPSFNSFARATSEEFAVKIGIGKVTFPSSREVIEPSAKNIAVIVEAFNKFYEEVQANINKRVASFANVEEAYKFALSPFVRSSGMDIVYGGRQISKVVYTGVKSFYIQGYTASEMKIYENKVLTMASADASVVILLDEEDADLSPETYRKYMRTAVLDLYVEHMKGSTTRHKSFNILLTTETDELHSVTSTVLKFSDLRKTPVAKGTAAPKITDEEAIRRAGNEVGNILKGEYHNRTLFSKFVKDGVVPILSPRDDDSHHGLQLAAELFGINDRIFITDNKRSVQTIRRGYPNAVTLEEFMESRTPEELAQAKTRLKDLRKLMKLVAVDSYALERIKSLKASNRLNENVVKLFREDLLVIAEPARVLFTHYRYSNKTTPVYKALSALTDVEKFKEVRTEAKSGPFSLADFGHSRGNSDELAAYLNWSAERHFAAQA